MARDSAAAADLAPSDSQRSRSAADTARGLTVRALLDELSRQAADAVMMDQAAEQMAHLRETDPDGWADYVDEGRAWEQGTIERLDA